MIYCIIGHRGTGKSFLLRSLNHYAQENQIQAQFHDLDDLIEETEKTKISKIFAAKGEDYFRDLEKKYFDQLYSSLDNTKTHFISIGAGYTFDLNLYNSFNYWISRKSDNFPRYFEDRPRLRPNISAEEEFIELFEDRNQKYLSHCDDYLEVPPLLSWPFECLAYFFQKANLKRQSFCLQSFHLKSFKQIYKHLIAMGISSFELRNDLLDRSEIDSFLKILPTEKCLISFRKQDKQLLQFCQSKNIAFDWPLEFGAPPENCFILSLHEVSPIDLEMQLDNFSRYESKVKYLKLAPFVEGFTDLSKIHYWSAQSPKRSFLPRSKNGKWLWYRHFNQKHNAINFLKNSPDSIQDQYSALEYLFYKHSETRFAAVLGSPISHSLSPSVHRNFFDSAFYPVHLESEDFTEALPVLQKFGLQYAAVTSPLKSLAFLACDEFQVQDIDTCNTLVLKNKIIGFNTDITGIESFKKNVSPSDSISIWGGGGTLVPILKTFPKANAYSVRHQRAREGFQDVPANVIIWAIGYEQFQTCSNYPPTQWPVRLVLDLNYTENSPGKSYAISCGAQYISGMDMFLSQANAQQKIWKEYGSQ